METINYLELLNGLRALDRAYKVGTRWIWVTYYPQYGVYVSPLIYGDLFIGLTPEAVIANDECTSYPTLRSAYQSNHPAFLEDLRREGLLESLPIH